MRYFEINGGVITSISLVKVPAITRYFSVNDSLKQIVAPIIIPDLPIYRYEPIDGIEPEEFYVIWTEDGIKRVVRDFYLKGGNIFTLYHNNRLQTDNEINLYGLWVINRTLGIMPPEGYDLPDYTVMGNVEILDDDLWQLIKRGEFNGFSVEGEFDVKEIMEV